MEKQPPKEPTQALVVKRTWVTRILKANKTWELRGTRLKKRGRFALAVSKISLLAGEVTFVDSFPVGIRRDGKWQPFSNSTEDQERFLLRPENLQKHQVDPNSISYHIVYAWVMTAPQTYNPERPYTAQPGPLWQSLRPTTETSTEKTEPIKTANRRPQHGSVNTPDPRHRPRSRSPRGT